MTHNWILDVLTDLKAYAQKNDLVAIAEQLDDARHVAVTELVALSGGESRIEGGEPLAAPHEQRVGGAV